jgi:hypothetical protein
MPADRTALRALPSVDELVRRLGDDPRLEDVSRTRVTIVAREVLDAEQVKRLAAGHALEESQPVAARPVVEEDEPRPRTKERAPIVPALNKPLPQE